MTDYQFPREVLAIKEYYVSSGVSEWKALWDAIDEFSAFEKGEPVYDSIKNIINSVRNSNGRYSQIVWEITEDYEAYSILGDMYL